MAQAFKLERPWDEVKEKLKETNIKLTDEDLQYTPGQEEDLISRLEKRLGKTADEIRVWIESVSANASKAG